MNYNNIHRPEPITDKRLNEIIAEPVPYRVDGLTALDLMTYFQDHVWVSSETKSLEKKLVEPSWKFMCPKRMKAIFTRALKASWCTAEHRELINAVMPQLEKAR